MVVERWLSVYRADLLDESLQVVCLTCPQSWQVTEYMTSCMWAHLLFLHSAVEAFSVLVEDPKY